MQLGKGGLLRSKGGCKTCKIRRVKCDETKPACLRCHRDRRKCDGYSRENHPAALQRSTMAPPKSAPPPATALPMLPEFDDSQQRHSFAFFLSCISDASTVYFGANFWAHRVLQLSLSESSIRYGLCSLSALQQIASPLSQGNSNLALELRSYALQQYNHAVRWTRELLAETFNGSQDKIVKGLVACALFVCYENFNGNFQLSDMHLQNGLKIIAREVRKSGSAAVPRDIVQVFKRLDIQAMSLRDSKIPYPDHVCNEPIELISAPPPVFNTIEDSVDLILHVFRHLFRRAAGLNSCAIPQEELRSATKVLERWGFDVETTFEASNPDKKAVCQRPVALLRMYHIIMSIIIETYTDVVGRETLHDRYLDKYRQLVELADGLLSDGYLASPKTHATHFFSFDIGMIFPLFWTATKCRDPITRRRAVTLLSSMHHQEGTWTCTNAAKVAKILIAIEEEGLLPGFSQEDVPELARVHMVNTAIVSERGEIVMSCLLRSNLDGDDFGWYTREGRVASDLEIPNM